MEAIPDPALVVLFGPSGAGKTTWAARHFRPEEIISSDRLRAMVGSGEHDLEASADAFLILDQMVEARLRRRLLTVVDTLGLDDQRRMAHLNLASELGMPAILVVFDVPESLVRDRNRARSRPVPASVLTSQLRRFRQVVPRLPAEGWRLVTPEQTLEIRPTHIGVDPEPEVVSSPRAGLRFLLHIPRFVGEGSMRERVLSLATAAEQAGFDGISVMDHLVQIPQVGREWEDLPEAYTLLAYLAAITSRLRLGALVTNVTLRNPALLAKTVATLDDLSRGRAFCGLGAGWFEEEQKSYGYRFWAASRRVDELEDALHILPLMWAPGKATYQGKVWSVQDAVCYPRPQGRIPIIMGGGGKRMIGLAARHADGLNLIGNRALDQRLEILNRALVEAGRNPGSFDLSILDVPLLGADRSAVAALVERHRGRRSASAFAARHQAGTARDHVTRYQRLIEKGVSSVFVSPVGLATPDDVAAWQPVIEAFG
ncbi:MAG: LLM class flavin-dependent oxidoreductase [Acidimicrobiia bacterium]